MPWWSRRPQHAPIQQFPYTVGARPTDQLESQAWGAFYRKDWLTAELLLKEVIVLADPEGVRLAKGMLFTTMERQGKIDEVLAMYEADSKTGVAELGTYQHLARLYHRRKQFHEEAELLRRAIDVYQQHRWDTSWFRDQLAKAEALAGER